MNMFSGAQVQLFGATCTANKSKSPSAITLTFARIERVIFAIALDLKKYRSAGNTMLAIGQLGAEHVVRVYAHCG